MKSICLRARAIDWKNKDKESLRCCGSTEKTPTLGETAFCAYTEKAKNNLKIIQSGRKDQRELATQYNEWHSSRGKNKNEEEAED